MTPWEFVCCCEGYEAAHASGKEEDLPELSYDEFKTFMSG